MCSASDSMNINSKSIIKTLKEDHILNDSLLVSLNSISLEDLIAVKLELSAVHLNNRLYGFDIRRAYAIHSLQYHFPSVFILKGRN